MQHETERLLFYTKIYFSFSYEYLYLPLTRDQVHTYLRIYCNYSKGINSTKKHIRVDYPLPSASVSDKRLSNRLFSFHRSTISNSISLAINTT